jgi:hypothetical protein
MSDYAFDFQRDGVAILPSVLSDKKLGKIVDSCEDSISGIVGTRNVLNLNWATCLAEELKTHPEISSILGSSSKVIQCNYFSKNTDNNWYVTLHRDLSIPVAEEIESDKWSGWNVKEGQLYAQPPRAVLESLVAVRIHFEDNDENNGALEVVKGSHKTDCDNSETIVCRVGAGGALVISPLVLHKSSKLKSGSRRVLHFVFGPHNLPDGASWPQ